ncbi:MAG: aminoacyl-tRNA hydrolase [Clostridiales Family XIII bacterium]|jgi:PTH1 family peptidyl-tRNA hydrolase|nr:aminoacyl-tRNA hydrolase [Clostridiales Family XIII bacterium]
MEKILLAGLGNPGERYEKTRHNLGFMVADSVAKKLNDLPYFLDIEFTYDKKSISLLSIFNFNNKKIYLTKPQTFMNNSGYAIKQIKDYYDIKNENIFVIHDDLDIPLSKLRIRKKGSSGGHNGLKSIIAHLGSNEFKRLKIGIGKPEKKEVLSYVTGKFNDSEMKELPKIVELARDEVIEELKK